MLNSIKFSRTLLLSLMVCAFLSVGYAQLAHADTQANNSAAQVVQFKASLKKVDDSSFTATGDKGAAHATVVIKRKGLLDKDAALDPEIDSPYNNDVVIYNRHGNPIGTNNANSVPVVDPATGNITAQKSLQDFTPTQPTQAEQIEDLQSALNTIKSMKLDKNIGKKFRWELRTAESLAQWGLDHANDKIEGRVKVEATPDLKAVDSKISGVISINRMYSLSGASAAAGYDYTYQTYIRWKNCCWSFGQHSAVLVNIYYTFTGVYAGSVSTRNHGTEASDSSMLTAANCPKAWSGRTSAYPYFQPYVGSDTYGTGDAGGCGTAYGLTSGLHVCNDDSLAEYSNLKYNSVSSWLTCNDSSLRTTAPSCD